MVAALMKSRTITAVVVGADRVAANGDTANKIGTYQVRNSCFFNCRKFAENWQKLWKIKDGFRL